MFDAHVAELDAIKHQEQLEIQHEMERTERILAMRAIEHRAIQVQHEAPPPLSAKPKKITRRDNDTPPPVYQPPDFSTEMCPKCYRPRVLRQVQLPDQRIVFMCNECIEKAAIAYSKFHLYTHGTI